MGGNFAWQTFPLCQPLLAVVALLAKNLLDAFDQ
jgi:hypothetical protein